MSVNFFKPEDFSNYREVTAEGAAQIANRLLEERGLRVYSGWHSHERGHSRTDMWSTSYWPQDKATDQALLINIQPIQQETTENIEKFIQKIAENEEWSAAKCLEFTKIAKKLLKQKEK